MSRLIDADELKKCVLKWLPKDPCGRQEKEMPFETDICVSMLMEIEEQPTIQSEQHWIPCSERLPEDDTVVLVCGRSGGVYTAIHNNSKTWIRGWWKMNSKNHHCNPTAWMPLPKPWEGEGNV